MISSLFSCLPEPAAQLQNIEVFFYIVVRPAVKTHQLVRILAFGREHDDGHIREFPDAHTGFQPVDLGHHHIQNDKVVFPAAGQLHGGATVIDPLHLVALMLQIELDTLDEQSFVIHH